MIVPLLRVWLRVLRGGQSVHGLPNIVVFTFPQTMPFVKIIMKKNKVWEYHAILGVD
jgi:hypothetical protein